MPLTRGTVAVALLRGINVGGRNRLAMADLAAIFREAGCTDVQTYIQSGNVVFRAPRPLLDRLPRLVSARIAADFALGIPVILRTGAELARVLDDDPFGAHPVETRHVVFLSARAAPDRVAGLDPARSPGDAFRVQGREIHLHCPHGLGRSRLTNDWFDRALGTTSTVRNVRTVLALRDLAATLPASRRVDWEDRPRAVGGSRQR